MPVTIPALPEHLRVVPPGPTSGSDPRRPELVAAWVDWATQFVAYRHYWWAVLDGALPHPQGIPLDMARDIERVRCKADKLYCISMYMHVFETDPGRLARYPWYDPAHGGWLPAIPFEFQAQMIRWFEARFRNEHGISNGIIAKPRRMGATDWAVCYALANWLTENPYMAKFVSRKAGLVYDPGNMDAILQRAIAKLDDGAGNAPIPGWLLPPGWNYRYHVSEMQVSRPDNKNLLGGEATTDRAGRGGRATEAFLDEAAVMERLPMIIGAVQATAPHVYLMSSETVEKTEDFVEIKEKTKANSPEQLFEIDWWQHPFQDQEWLKAEEQRYIDQNNHEAFFREILREPWAGYEGWMYQDAQSMSVLEYGLNYDPNANMSASLDVFIDPGYADETALIWCLSDTSDGHDVIVESYSASGYPAEYYAAILCGVDPDAFPEFHFDLHARETIEWVRSVRLKPRRICGDPAGFQQHGGRDDDWYSRMIRFWEAHNPEIDPLTGRPRVYPILVNWSMKHGREIQARRQSLMAWLRSGRLLFNDTPDVRKVLLALQRTRWYDSEKRITEQKDTFHDIHSHRRSAMEYGAVNREESAWTSGPRFDAQSHTQRRLDQFVQRKPGEF